jgi:predicted metal-binding membrane protein
LKRRCLQGCREAASRGGLRAGLVSVGSCGLLMLVLFVTGVMSVPAMALLTALLVLERVLPPRSHISSFAGAGLLLFAAWKLLA